MGLEINEKQVGLSEELKKISGLTTMERLKASTQIARDSATLNEFTRKLSLLGVTRALTLFLIQVYFESHKPFKLLLELCFLAVQEST
ncbi:hypothetical protein WN943_007701 [Citrus x changshan-huyou]